MYMYIHRCIVAILCFVNCIHILADESLLKSPKLWAPVGGVVAGLVIAVIFIACYCWCKRRKENCERQGQVRQVRDEVENKGESSPLLPPSESKFLQNTLAQP